MAKKKDEFITRKVRLLGMLSKLPEDKLQELEEFLKKQIRKEIIHGQQLQEKSNNLFKEGG